MCFADFGERFRDIVKKCKHPFLTLSLVDVFKLYRLTLFFLCFPRVAFYSMQHNYFILYAKTRFLSVVGVGSSDFLFSSLQQRVKICRITYKSQFLLK